MSKPFDPDETTMFSTPSANPPGPGWWLADDGEWYPPETPPKTKPPAPGYWMASDGRWYPPSPDATTTIDPVPAPNQYQGWQPEPQPHDRLPSQAEPVPSAQVSQVETPAEDIDNPMWAKAIGVVFLLFFLVTIAFALLGA